MNRGLALLFALFVGTATAEPQTNTSTESNSRTLSDISGHWAEPQIKKAIAAGYVQ
jgi:hypothetical protein